MTATPDLAAAASALDQAQAVVDSAVGVLARDSIDTRQVLAYEVAHAAAALATGRGLLDYGAKGDAEAAIASAFVADAVGELAGKTFGREAEWGVEPGALDGTREFLASFRAPEFLASIDDPGPRHLDDDFELVAETFRRFAEKELAPIAEHIHRTNDDIPEEIISGLAELGAFGLSIPAEYGGFGEGGEGEYIGMVVATEELARGSLCAGGSLITRPEILTRALLAGGTEEQKHEWLPRLASAEVMNAVAVTEPDFGSDAGGVKVTATSTDGGWLINGVKTWCTFGARADVLMLLARTDPDRSIAHRGLSMFIATKPRGDGHGFELTQDAGVDGAPGGGRMEGRPIDTVGYRGMHSYEIALEDWFVPAENLIGMEGGEGRGFYYQMAGFENGRIQTAARALGVMQAAYEAARQYALDRVVFGQPVAEYQLTRAKLGRMAVIIQAARQFAYEVARLMAKGEGQMEASLIKAYVCKASEWVTREAMQIHGGMGYAEEFDVSRYWVDARVLSIFEGADEVLCLRVIAKRLVADHEGASAATLTLTPATHSELVIKLGVIAPKLITTTASSSTWTAYRERMIEGLTGLHTIIYSEDAATTRAFLADILGWPSVDAGGGWLIFRTPPAEMGVHPTEGEGGEKWGEVPRHQVSFMCDDIEVALADLRSKGVEVTSEPVNQGFGLVATIAVPAAGDMMIYQPLHPLAHSLPD